jgi:hypothetical protein
LAVHPPITTATATTATTATTVASIPAMVHRAFEWPLLQRPLPRVVQDVVLHLVLLMVLRVVLAVHTHTTTIRIITIQLYRRDATGIAVTPVAVRLAVLLMVQLLDLYTWCIVD